MKILLLGAAGFIGTNLAIELAKDKKNEILLIDRNKLFFTNKELLNSSNISIKESSLEVDINFDELLYGQDVVYHLVSTTVPSTSNQHISREIMTNVIFSSNLFDACVRCKVKKVIFLSSGGTVYGIEEKCPLKETSLTNPISSYGVQKLTIEKLLYLYRYIHGLDYRIIRLANPYGPYQRPNGVLGAISTFTYKTLKKEQIIVYGDGSVVRDYIYIDDAIYAIMKISNGDAEDRTFNIGSGYGVSIRQVLQTIKDVLSVDMDVIYIPGRDVDVPTNYLDISRFQKNYGLLELVSLEEGIIRTAKFMKKQYSI